MRALAFAATFICFFFMTYAFLGLVDALPNPPESADTASREPASAPEPVAQDARELPVRVVVLKAAARCHCSPRAHAKHWVPHPTINPALPKFTAICRCRSCRWR